MSKIDDLAKEVAAEFRATGRRLSVQTVEEFLALVRPYYVALDPPAPPRARRKPERFRRPRAVVRLKSNFRCPMKSL